jgi:iron complex outermembrane receptor protein
MLDFIKRARPPSGSRAAVRARTSARVRLPHAWLPLSLMAQAA